MARAQAAWGIDIGTTALKAVKLRRGGDKAILEAFDIVEHDNFLTEPDIDIEETIRHSLAKLLERTPIGRDPVFISDQGGSTFARFVKLPPVEPKKVPEIVRFEAIQQIPFPLDQVNWDYQTFQSPDAPDIEVGIFAMRKELVTKLLGNFRTTNLKIEGVQMTPLADFNTLMFNNITEGKGTVVLDIGASHTDLIIVDQGRLWLRTINIGGNHFTDALAKGFKQPFTRAEKLKKTAATSKYARQIFQAMRPTFSDLVQEIQRSMGYYNSSHRDSRLEQVVGMGSSFKLPNLQKFLQQYLGMPVMRMDALRNITSGEGKLEAAFNEQILTLPAACGLALQALETTSIDTNLLPIEVARQMLWRRKQPWFAATAALVVLGTGLAAARIFLDRAAFARDAHSPQASSRTDFIMSRQNILNQYQQATSSFVANEKKAKSYIHLDRDRVVWPLLLKDVFEALPQSKVPGYTPTATTEKRKNRSVIVIQSITSAYSGNLSKAKVSAIQQQNPGGMPQPMGGAYVPNQRLMPPQFRGPMLGPVPAMPQVTATTAGPPVAGERGFILLIRGYTPAGSVNGNRLLDQFKRALLKLAPKGKGNNKLFYIVWPPHALTRLVMGQETSGQGGVGHAWGRHPGPFAKVFQLDFLSPAQRSKVLRRQRQGNNPQNFRGLRGGAAFGGNQFGGNPLGAAMANGANGQQSQLGMLDPDTFESMRHDLAFSVQLKVHLLK